MSEIGPNIPPSQGNARGLDPSLDPKNLGKLNPFPKAKSLEEQTREIIARSTPRLLAAAREQTSFYPVVAVGIKLFLENGGVFDFVRPCTTMTVDINGYKEADIADVEVNYNDFPYDPRLCKQIIVSVWVDYVNGLIAPSDPRQAKQIIRAENPKLLFEGYVDEYRVKGSAGDGMCAQFKARDYTALLIDTKMMEGHFHIIRGNEKFTSIVKKLCQPFNLTVVFSEGLEASAPTVSQYFDDKDHRLVEESSSYWDVILKLADMIGCIAFVFGTKVYFGEPHPLKVFQAMHETSGRSNLSYVWGENVQEFELARKYTENFRFTNVEVVAYDPDKKGQDKRIVVYYPDPPKEQLITQIDGKITSQMRGGEATPNPTRLTQSFNRPTRETPRVAQPAAPAADGVVGGTVSAQGQGSEKAVRKVYRVFAPQYVNDINILKKKAKQIWEQLTKGEIEGRMKVMGHSEMVVGNAFQIHMNREHLQIARTYPDAKQREELLKRRGFHPTMANQLAKAFGEWDKQWWYILQARHRYSDDEGYEVDADFVSFVNIDTDNGGPTPGAQQPTQQRGGKATSQVHNPQKQQQTAIKPTMGNTGGARSRNPISTVIPKAPPLPKPNIKGSGQSGPIDPSQPLF